MELGKANIGQLARALTEALRRIGITETRRLRPDDETVRSAYEALDELQAFRDEMLLGA